jgi:predicted nucleic acid-binding protein
MRAVVVDASVAGAFAFGEPRYGEALALLRGARLLAPPLLIYELTSVARKKALANPPARAAITDALRFVLALPWEWVEPDPAQVLELAILTGLTTYDATYLWVGQRARSAVATFDNRLAAAGR